MATVDEQVRHILFHVEAEAATRDSSQATGVATRAQRVRDLVTPLVGDNRNRTRKSLLLDLRGTSDVTVRGALNEIDADDDGQPLHQMLTTWVGKNRVHRG